MVWFVCRHICKICYSILVTWSDWKCRSIFTWNNICPLAVSKTGHVGHKASTKSVRLIRRHHRSFPLRFTVYKYCLTDLGRHHLVSPLFLKSHSNSINLQWSQNFILIFRMGLPTPGGSRIELIQSGVTSVSISQEGTRPHFSEVRFREMLYSVWLQFIQPACSPSIPPWTPRNVQQNSG